MVYQSSGSKTSGYCCSSCALSSQVYLKDPGDGDLFDRVYTLLSHLAEEKIYGFERVFTKEEVKDRYGLDGAFSFVLETDGFTTFSDSWVRSVNTHKYALLGDPSLSQLPWKATVSFTRRPDTLKALDRIEKFISSL